jgi:hypothetical protein
LAFVQAALTLWLRAATALLCTATLGSERQRKLRARLACVWSGSRLLTGNSLRIQQGALHWCS